MRAVIVGPHPVSTTGFVRVAVNVARQLMRRGWVVTYLVVDRSGRCPSPPDLDVVVIEHIDDIAPSLASAIEPATDREPVEIVCFGVVWHSAAVAGALYEASRPDHVNLSVYVAVDHAPAAPGVEEVAVRFDRVIPSSRFGQVTFGDWIACDPPIPHGVDTGLFRPRTPQRRRAIRQALFDTSDDRFIVGYFGRNSGHKRADLALRVLSTVVRGAAMRCTRCAHLTVHELDNGGAPTVVATNCRACGGRLLAPEPARDMHMYLHTDVAYRRMWVESGGSDLVLLAEHLGVADRVRFADLERPDQGTADEDLVDLMNACDVHMMLSEGAGWELTVLETGACGVANIVTDHAAPSEYAGPFSRLVPPAYFHLDDRGCRAIVDLDGAADALIGLHDDPDARAVLAGRGPEVAAQYSWDRVGDLWHERLLDRGGR